MYSIYVFYDRLIGHTRKIAKGLIYGKENVRNPNADFPLTERLSYILKYKETVSPTDVIDIVNTPGYEIMAPYFGLKLLDQKPLAQKQMLEDISNGFLEGKGYKEASRIVVDFLKPNQQVASKFSLASVSPEELSRIAAWGPNNVSRRANEVALNAKQDHLMPILVAYGGLVGLKSAVENTVPNDTIMIVMPKRVRAVQKGFRITRSDTKMRVDELSETDFAGTFQAAIIDDTTRSGNTFSQVRQLFPNAQLTNSPLFHT